MEGYKKLTEQDLIERLMDKPGVPDDKYDYDNMKLKRLEKRVKGLERRNRELLDENKRLESEYKKLADFVKGWVEQ